MKTESVASGRTRRALLSFAAFLAILMVALGAVIVIRSASSGSEIGRGSTSGQTPNAPDSTSTTAAAPPSTAAPGVTTSAPAPAPAPTTTLSTPPNRYDPANSGCPYVPTGVAGRWAVSSGGAPRSNGAQTGPGEPLSIGLWNKDWTAGDTQAVRATVYAPDGSAATSPVGTQSSALNGVDFTYPSGFSRAPGAYPAGVYTIIWTTDDGRYITCDGWIAG